MEADQVPTLTECQNWECDCRQGPFCARRDAGLPNALDDFLAAVREWGTSVQPRPTSRPAHSDFSGNGRVLSGPSLGAPTVTDDYEYAVKKWAASKVGCTWSDVQSVAFGSYEGWSDPDSGSGENSACSVVAVLAGGREVDVLDLMHNAPPSFAALLAEILEP